MMSRRGGILLAACAALVAAAALPLSGQARSASATMAVSVTVVRSCSVATPTASPAPIAGRDSTVQIRCGRAPASSSLQSPSGILPVAGTPAPAAIETSRTLDGLLVAVNF